MHSSGSGDNVEKSVFLAIADYNTSDDGKVPTSSQTILLGEGGTVDSLGLVRLIVTIERQIEKDFGVAVSLTDEKAMSQRTSPFRSVGSLIAYITTALNEAR